MSDKADITESYQKNDYPLFIKLLFAGLIVWGMGYFCWYVASGWTSEAELERSLSKYQQPAVTKPAE